MIQVNHPGQAQRLAIFRSAVTDQNILFDIHIVCFFDGSKHRIGEIADSEAASKRDIPYTGLRHDQKGSFFKVFGFSPADLHLDRPRGCFRYYPNVVTPVFWIVRLCDRMCDEVILVYGNTGSSRDARGRQFNTADLILELVGIRLLDIDLYFFARFDFDCCGLIFPFEVKEVDLCGIGNATTHCADHKDNQKPHGHSFDCCPARWLITRIFLDQYNTQ